MKKFVSFILSFALLSGIIGGKLFMSGATAVAEDIEEEELEPDFLISEICASSRINVTEADDSSFTAFYITTEDYLPTIENGSDSAEVRIDIEVSYGYAGDTELTLTHEDSEYFERLTAYPEFDAEKKTITGNVDLFNDCGELEQINIFEYNEDGEDEDIEDGDWENDGIDTQALALSALFSRVALKIVTVAVVAVVAAVVRTYPTFVSDTVEALCDAAKEIGYFLIHGVRYKYILLSEAIIETVIVNEGFSPLDIYYLVIPITSDNLTFYNNKHPDLKLKKGDMLFSNIAIRYQQAKNKLREGYSIYTFKRWNAYKVVKCAWFGSPVIYNNAHKNNFYQHYHPGYKVNGIFKRRQGFVDGMWVDIHGFFGRPVPDVEKN